MSCNICCEKYKKDPVVCGFCSFAACNDCCETYLLSETKPKCMNISCGKDWDRKFIKANLRATFINNRYKKYMENILYEKEKALMPATQPLVENEIRKNKLQQDSVEISRQIDLLTAEYNRKIFDLKEEKRSIEYEKHMLGSRPIITNNNKYNYVRACPADGCRGFLNSKFNCGLCDTNVCRKCNEIIVNSDTEHKCSEENIATVKLLEKDTRPCPKCAANIFKIDGCDQMWCVQCHTAFSWKTGNIETKIHNPHYYDWKRKNGGLEPIREPIGGGAANCNNDLINEYTMNRLNDAATKWNHSNLLSIDKKPGYDTIKSYNKNYRCMLEIIRNTIHNHEVELPVFRTDIIKDNEKLRIQFMMNEISEEKFKTMLQRNNKKSGKNSEIYDILQFAETTLADIINRMVDDLKNSSPNDNKFQELFIEVNGLREYCNSAFEDISKTYDCVLYTFDNNFKFNTLIQNKNEIRKRVEMLENKARDWMMNLDGKGKKECPKFNPENPTACREAALKHFAVIRYSIYYTPNWITFVHDIDTNKDIPTCDMLTFTNE